MSKNTLRIAIIWGLFLVPIIPFCVSGALFFPFITTKAFAWRIIIEIVFALWIVLFVMDREFAPKRSMILATLGVFLSVIALADVFGMEPVKSFWSNFERMEGFVALLHLGAFFLVISSVFNEILWSRWWNASLAASAIMVLYSFLQLGGSIPINQGGARVDGTFGNASYLAVYMLIHMFIALFYFVRTQNREMKWMYGILMLGQLVTLYHTATRGAILGLIGGLLVTALLNIWSKENARARKFGMIGVVATLIFIGTFFSIRQSSFVTSSPVLSRFANLSMESVKGEGRAFVWPMAIEGIKDRPILGWGQENFNYVFNEHYQAEMYKIEPWFDRAHNIFLDWGVAGGVLGLLAYLSLYVAYLVSVWRRKNGFSFAERAVLTGLLAAYFFHNFFVFDNLVSYVLFFALLAFVHFRTAETALFSKLSMSREGAPMVIVPVAIVLLVFMYVGVMKPLGTNGSLLSAMREESAGNGSGAMMNFKKAYASSRLGRPEVVEYVVNNSQSVFRSKATDAEKQDLFMFAGEAVKKQAAESNGDARYELFAGMFFAHAGDTEQGLTYLRRALALSPEKQAIRFEIGLAYVNSGNISEGLKELQAAYDLAPENPQAQTLLLYAAIKAHDDALIAALLKVIPIETLATHASLLQALAEEGNYNVLTPILEERLKQNPKDPQTYISTAATYIKLGQTEKAIQTLVKLGVALPEVKTAADAYIKDIRSGKINKNSF